jgi:hypothetical protein
MTDNLSVSVTADVSELQAQLALAKADLRAFTAETSKLANSIRSGGDAGGLLRGQLEQVAGQAVAAKSNVVNLTAAMRDHTAAHREAASGIKAASDYLDHVDTSSGTSPGLGLDVPPNPEAEKARAVAAALLAGFGKVPTRRRH